MEKLTADNSALTDYNSIVPVNKLEDLNFSSCLQYPPGSEERCHCYSDNVKNSTADTKSPHRIILTISQSAAGAAWLLEATNNEGMCHTSLRLDDRFDRDNYIPCDMLKDTEEIWRNLAETISLPLMKLATWLNISNSNMIQREKLIQYSDLPGQTNHPPIRLDRRAIARKALGVSIGALATATVGSILFGVLARAQKPTCDLRTDTSCFQPSITSPALMINSPNYTKDQETAMIVAASLSMGGAFVGAGLLIHYAVELGK